MSHTKRECNFCHKEYLADNRNLRRGWGLCCSKSCAAKARERKRPDYDPAVVASNNIKRETGGADLWARKHGYPNFQAYEMDEDDGSWDAHGGVELVICDYCNLRSDYCQCDEYLDEIID